MGGPQFTHTNISMESILLSLLLFLFTCCHGWRSSAVIRYACPRALLKMSDSNEIRRPEQFNSGKRKLLLRKRDKPSQKVPVKEEIQLATNSTSTEPNSALPLLEDSLGSSSIEDRVLSVIRKVVQDNGLFILKSSMFPDRVEAVLSSVDDEDFPESPNLLLLKAVHREIFDIMEADKYLNNFLVNNEVSKNDFVICSDFFLISLYETIDF